MLDLLYMYILINLLYVIHSILKGLLFSLSQ